MRPPEKAGLSGPMIRIALDALGGENVSSECLKAVPAFLRKRSDCSLVFASDRRLYSRLRSAAGSRSRDRLSWAEAPERIGFEEAPVAALKAKRGSSVRAVVEAVAEGRADAALSFGHTGAAAAATQLFLGMEAGVLRPGIAALVPNRKGLGVLIDAGANLKCRAEHLLQYALLGRAYSSWKLGVARPRVGLLNIGAEDKKGDELLRRAHGLLKDGCPDFAGNAEGCQVFDGTIDVAVCGGLSGNMILKAGESLASMIFDSLYRELSKGGGASGAAAAKRAIAGLAARLNPDARGACRLLGVRGILLVGHGSAGAEAIASGLERAREEALQTRASPFRGKAAAQRGEK